MYHSPGQINPDNDPSQKNFPGQINPQQSQSRKNKVDQLLGIVIQVKDLQAATIALEKIGLEVLRLSSSGGFLGQQNITLLVGIETHQFSTVIDIIHTNCHERTEYIATPLESVTLPMPLATPIPVGGATIFSLPVAQFVEI